MTDQELKDLVAQLAITQAKMLEDSKQREKERLERGEQREKERLERGKQREKERLEREKERLEREKERQAEEKAHRIAVERDFKKMRRELGDFGRRWGTFTEGLVIPSLKRILEKEFGISDTSEHPLRSIGNDHLEIDIFGSVNTDINNAVIVEIKSHLRDDGIEQLLTQLEKFPKFYPEHANKKLFGMIACVSAATNVRNILRNKGIYLVIMGQEVARLQRPENFVPTNFNQV